MTEIKSGIKSSLERSSRQQIHEAAEYFVPVLAIERQRKLGGEQAIFDADVIPMPVQLAGKVLLAFSQLLQSGSKLHAAISGPSNFLLQQVHHRGCQGVHSKKAKVMARPQAGHDKFLLSLSRRGLLQHLRNFIKTLSCCHQMASDRAIERQLALMRCLNGRDSALLCGGYFDQLLRGPLLAAADVKVVTHEQQERFGADEVTRAKHRMTITQRGALLDEPQPATLAAGGRGIGLLISRANHDTDFVDPGGEYFLDNDAQRSFGNAIAVHQRLQGKRALGFASGGDDGFFDFH